MVDLRYELKCKCGNFEGSKSPQGPFLAFNKIEYPRTYQCQRCGSWCEGQWRILSTDSVEGFQNDPRISEEYVKLNSAWKILEKDLKKKTLEDMRTEVSRIRLTAAEDAYTKLAEKMDNMCKDLEVEKKDRKPSLLQSVGYGLDQWDKDHGL